MVGCFLVVYSLFGGVSFAVTMEVVFAETRKGSAHGLCGLCGPLYKQAELTRESIKL